MSPRPLQVLCLRRKGSAGVRLSRDRIIDALGALGIPCYQGSCSEVYLEKLSMARAWRPDQPLPVARRTLGETSLMFLVHPTLTDAEVERCVVGIESVLQVLN